MAMRAITLILLSLSFLHAQTTLTLSSSSVVLNNDQAQSITVTGGNMVAYSVTGVPAWLSVSSANNFTTPDMLAFRLASSICGACVTTVTLTPSDGGPPAQVAVSFNVNGGGGSGAINANPSSLSISAPGGQSTSQMVTLSTTASSPVTITSLTTTQSWLTASLSAFVVSANNSVILTVTANGAGYSNTTLNGQVVVTPAAGTALTIPVQFMVGAGGGGGNTTIAAPPTLSFAWQVNQAVPAYQLITVAPSGTFTATATVGTSQQWLNVSPSTGTGPGFVLVSISPVGLTPATYPGTITVGTSSGTQTISVNLLVSAGTVLNSNPGSLNITTTGSATPTNYPLQLSASDGSNQPVNVSSPNSWITLVSTTSPNTPNTTTVQINPAGLCNGLNSGSVVVTSGAANNPLVIPVVVLISGGASASCGSAPVPQGVSPGSGASLSQTMSFSFTDPRGFQDLGVVNILINNVLDGRGACYLAYSQPTGVLYLVNDSGTALLPGITLNGAGSVGNSQCTVNSAGSYVSGSTNALTLVLNMSFTLNFPGNKVIYLAARDQAQDNSGWQPLGTWAVPGGVTAGGPSVTGLGPARGAGSNVTFSVTVSDTNGVQDLGIVNILINNSLDGRQACYLAYSVPLNVLYLVNDTGTGLLGGLAPGTTGTMNNSQCGITMQGVTVNPSLSGLTLAVPISFTTPFDGNKIVFVAARSVGDVATSGWQAVGSWTVQ